MSLLVYMDQECKLSPHKIILDHWHKEKNLPAWVIYSLIACSVQQHLLLAEKEESVVSSAELQQQYRWVHFMPEDNWSITGIHTNMLCEMQMLIDGLENR